jgi:putative glutamine amidotransferase
MWWFNRAALLRAGARSQRLCAGEPVAVERFDGFVIGGGDDIEATLYGGKIEPAIRIDRERDAFELKLLEAAAGRGLPLLGICRGAQIINVFMGGTLHESIYDVYPGIPRVHSPLPKKTIEIIAGSKQWHPEFMIFSRSQQRLFRALVDAARRRRQHEAAHQGSSVPS